MYGELSDGELVEKARGGSQDAWDALVDRFAKSVWAVARSYRLNAADADDVHQLTFLRLMNSLQGIREPEKVGAWLRTTAKRECLRLLRQSGRSQPRGDEERFDVADERAEPLDAGVIRDERAAELWRALRLLSPNCQTLLRLRMGEVPYAEISDTLGMRPGSIGPTIGRCLEKLKGLLRGINGDDGGS